jgi:CheY-like chemotaxis protein
MAKQYSGTGLGLAIVKNYSELLKGEINFTSEFGKGSTFTLNIPFEIPIKQQSQIESTNSEISFEKTELRILLAEDDGINQLYMKSFLTAKGMIVDTAFNGLQAIEKYKSNHYDLILMDGQMPRMDGIEATRLIRILEKEKNIHTPIIAMTGYAVSGDKEKFISFGMDDYISKPVDEKRLMELIQKYTEK